MLPSADKISIHPFLGSYRYEKVEKGGFRRAYRRRSSASFHQAPAFGCRCSAQRQAYGPGAAAPSAGQRRHRRRRCSAQRAARSPICSPLPQRQRYCLHPGTGISCRYILAVSVRVSLSAGAFVTHKHHSTSVVLFLYARGVYASQTLHFTTYTSQNSEGSTDYQTQATAVCRCHCQTCVHPILAQREGSTHR